MKPQKYEVNAGFNAGDLNMFGVISDDKEHGLGIEIMPHQWIGITIWNGDKETSICLEWECGKEFLDAIGFHSRYIETMTAIVSQIQEGENKEE